MDPSVNGREALFPSSYVEKIESGPVPQQRTLPPMDNKPAYRPFMAAHHGSDAPPSSGEGLNSVGLQQAPGQAEKQNSMGKYKNTLAHSAAGGVGFGAGKCCRYLVSTTFLMLFTGAAIGGGLVRAIF